mmetsp:Transcript_23559/g.26172  ORF Transcript_23559/g.26172 Transcript_23559/m.26172 type:complete len:363 (+) Transcript_23559:7-1095(+)
MKTLSIFLLTVMLIVSMHASFSSQALGGTLTSENKDLNINEVLQRRGLSGLCGNGAIDPGEECDNYNSYGGDGCDSNCHIETGWHCPSIHSCEPVYGDGFIVSNEQCDDGNIYPGDGCDMYSNIEPGWRCSGSPSSCTNAPCQNGVVDPGEECDDGNNFSGDGCDTLCRSEVGPWDCFKGSQYNPTVCVPHGCGDGSRGGAETCDDGNTEDDDGCNHFCQVETGWRCFFEGTRDLCMSDCGDGITLGCEECDDGNFISGDGCSSSCDIETGFTCNTPQLLGTSYCGSNCGDSMKATHEACDDGNSMPGDGCNETCQVESGWICDIEHTMSRCYQCDAGYVLNIAEERCDPICGDGWRVAGEQ